MKVIANDKRCLGHTTMEKFIDGLKLVKEKNLDNNLEWVSDTCQIKKLAVQISKK